MKILIRFVISFIILVTGNTNTYSKIPELINFSHISLNEGLSQSTVFSIDQDKNGNMWFATYDGVNKYNGYEFTVYQHDDNDPKTIANNIARIIKTDSEGRVWIGTREGLSCYDENKDRFYNYTLEKNGKQIQVNGIVEVSPNELLISTQNGLTWFNITQSAFNDSILSPEMRQLTASVLYRKNDIIYIGTPVGEVFTYSIQWKKLVKFLPVIRTKRIQAILQQSPTHIWIGTEGAGLLLVNPKTQEIKTYRHSTSNPQSISSNYIRSLALDAQNRLWIGTLNDLSIYHKNSDTFTSYSSSSTESGSLSQRSVRSIFMDSQGGMWLGTYFGGLNYYHPICNRFGNLRHMPYKNSISDNVVSCIIEDQQHNLWIGTNDGGLNLYNPANQHFTNYALEEDEREKGLGSNNIKAVYVDEKNDRVYIGSHAGGLNVLNRRTGKMINFNQHNSNLIDENIYAILPDEEGKLLLGTLKRLVIFDIAKQHFTSIDHDIKCIY